MQNANNISIESMVTGASQTYTQIKDTLDNLKEEGIYRSIDHELLCSRPKLSEQQTYHTIDEAIAQNGKNYMGVIYFHIPFCESTCSYCPYLNIPIANGKSVIDTYLDSMIKELSEYKEKFGILNASALYFGGGTPTSLTSKQIRKLFDAIKQHVTITDHTEITYEVSPVSLKKEGKEKLAALKDAGVTRISVGVQTFNKDILKECGRITSDEYTVDNAIKQIRDAGFHNVNIDLIYGLPTQKIEDFATDLTKAVALKPTSVTTYHLRLEDNTTFKNRYLNELGFKEKIPIYTNDSETIRMKIMATAYLERQGYHQMPTDWFVKDEGAHIAQYKKWHDQESLLGIGVSAYSSFGNGLKFKVLGNIADRMGSIREYISRITEGKPVIDSLKMQKKDERMDSNTALGLKTGVSLEQFKAVYNQELFAHYPNAARLIQLGALKIEDGELRLTAIGELLAEEVAAKLVQ